MTVHGVGSRDYYEVLGVDREATPDQIKDAFRQLALRYHPDRSSEPDAEERFKEIAAAYAVLSDPTRRATYDRGGDVGLTAEDFFTGIDLEDLFRDLGFGFDLGEGPFGGLFGARRGPRRGRDIEMSVTVTLDEVATGVVRRLDLPRRTTCSTCGGAGTAPGTERRPCDACGGRGQHVTERRQNGTVLRQITICSSCGGEGRIIDTPCPDCGGRGEQTSTSALEITIPIGVESGTALRLSGRGEPSPDPDGPPGDAYVVVRVAPDPRFDRRGPHLWRAETIDVVDAVLGTEIEAPTLDGEVRVAIPPGTQPGSILRLGGKGLPRGGGQGPGDLLLAVDVRIPTSLDGEQRRLWEALRQPRPAGS